MRNVSDRTEKAIALVLGAVVIGFIVLMMSGCSLISWFPYECHTCPAKYRVACDPTPKDWMANTWEDALAVYDRFTTDPYNRKCVIATPGFGPVNPDTIPGRVEP